MKLSVIIPDGGVMNTLWKGKMVVQVEATIRYFAGQSRERILRGRSTLWGYLIVHNNLRNLPILNYGG